jgi:hypothetical protein
MHRTVLLAYGRELEREELAASGGAALTASVGNLSLKEGEKIKINIGGVVSLVCLMYPLEYRCSM